MLVSVDGSVVDAVGLGSSHRRQVILGIRDPIDLEVERGAVVGPIAMGHVSCAGGNGLMPAVSMGLVVAAVLASAAGLLPWGKRSGSPPPL